MQHSVYTFDELIDLVFLVYLVGQGVELATLFHFLQLGLYLSSLFCFDVEVLLNLGSVFGSLAKVALELVELRLGFFQLVLTASSVFELFGLSELLLLFI